MTTPSSVITGPPEFPGDVGALIWMCLVPSIMRKAATNPSDTVPAKVGSMGAPITMTL